MSEVTSWTNREWWHILSWARYQQVNHTCNSFDSKVSWHVLSIQYFMCHVKGCEVRTILFTRDYGGLVANLLADLLFSLVTAMFHACSLVADISSFYTIYLRDYISANFFYNLWYHVMNLNLINLWVGGEQSHITPHQNPILPTRDRNNLSSFASPPP